MQAGTLTMSSTVEVVLMQTFPLINEIKRHIAVKSFSEKA